MIYPKRILREREKYFHFMKNIFILVDFPKIVLKKSIEKKEKSLEEIFKSDFQMEIITLGDFRKK